jgi:hypothetical protein
VESKRTILSPEDLQRVESIQLLYQKRIELGEKKIPHLLSYFFHFNSSRWSSMESINVYNDISTTA